MAVARPYRTRPTRVTTVGARRSNAAIPFAVGLVVLGLYLGTYSILLTGLLGVGLLFSAASLLSTRLNPLSATFYVDRKPSFLAIGVVFLSSLILFGGAYLLWVRQLGPLVPHL